MLMKTLTSAPTVRPSPDYLFPHFKNLRSLFAVVGLSTNKYNVGENTNIGFEIAKNAQILLDLIYIRAYYLFFEDHLIIIKKDI